MDALPEEFWNALANRYRLTDKIGQGGMARVYRAQDIRHDRNVAIKVLRPELGPTMGSERFLREISIESGFQHPHILPLYDSGESAGILYYVMPFVEGESLRERLVREEQLSIEDAVSIAREVGGALQYAHDRGIVHRDIKPGNILLSSGHALVADFGIARAVSEATGGRLTQTGLAIGTPAYMSPEQAGGDELDGRSDIYSLACVMFEMLTGVPPFEGKTARAILTRHMVDSPPAVDTVRPETPVHLVRAVEVALSKTPEERFDTAETFVHALEGGPIPLRRRKLTNRVKAGHVALAIGGLLAGFGGWVAAQQISSPALDPNKVVVFPLSVRGFASGDTTIGTDVAIAIQQAMVYADPLEVIEGQRWLGPPEEGEALILSAETARTVSLERGGRWYISGMVRRHPRDPAGTGAQLVDSVTVNLTLNDAAENIVVLRERESGALTEVEVLTIAAFDRLLPRILDPGRSINLGALLDRKPAAIALWIQGEREFRLSRFGPALDLYERALEEDSALVIAATKGALAANWRHDMEKARSLVDLAVASDSLLPNRYRSFVLGLQGHLAGNADTALSLLNQTLEENPGWAEAHALVGEVFYHLIPSEFRGPDAAEAAFREALALDSAFYPPLFHLTQSVIRKGKLSEADTLLSRFRSTEPDSTELILLELMFQCLAGGSSAAPWSQWANRKPVAVLGAATALNAGAVDPGCAEGGFAALLAEPKDGDELSGRFDIRWGAFMGMQSLLAAQGSEDRLTALFDSAVEAQTRHPIQSLYFHDALATGMFESRADSIDAYVRSVRGDSYENLTYPPWEWLMGAWNARKGEMLRLRQLARALAEQAEETADRSTTLFAEALGGHVALLAGDTLEALAIFSGLSSAAPPNELAWAAESSFPYERLKRAELLIATGAFQEAYQVASAFDHPEPVIFTTYLPASLRLRYLAAQAVGWADSATSNRKRLQKLGRQDLVTVGN